MSSGGCDDADVEVVRPDAIDEGPGEVRIVLAPQPVHERRAGVRHVVDVDVLAAQNPGPRLRRRLSLAIGIVIVRRSVAAAEEPSHTLAEGNRHARLELLADEPGEYRCPPFSCRRISSLSRISLYCAWLSLSGARSGGNATRLKKPLNGVEVVLRPLVERMLVALGALDANPQERVGKANRPLLRLAEVIAAPSNTACCRGRRISSPSSDVDLAHLLAIVGVALPGLRLVARRSPRRSCRRDVLGDPLVDPVVPALRGDSLNGLRLLSACRCCRCSRRAWSSTRRHRRGCSELVDLCGPLVCGERVGQEGFDFDGVGSVPVRSRLTRRRNSASLAKLRGNNAQLAKLWTTSSSILLGVGDLRVLVADLVGNGANDGNGHDARCRKK